jgi:uncharacterized protein
MSPRYAVLRTALVSTLITGFVFAASPGYSAAEEATQEAAAQVDTVSDEYRKTLSKLLEVIGASVAGEQLAYAIAQETLGAIAATGTPITEQIQQVVVEEALAEFVPSFGDLEYLTDLYAPLYSQHLTEKELSEMLAFYQSPIGQKVLVTLPTVAQSGAMALQQAGLERLPDFQVKVDKKLRDIGVIVAP